MQVEMLNKWMENPVWVHLDNTGPESVVDTVYSIFNVELTLNDNNDHDTVVENENVSKLVSYFNRHGCVVVV